MSALRCAWVVMCKELRDLGRDRRTLAISLLLMPLLYPLLLLGVGLLQQQRIQSQGEAVLEVPVVGREQAPNLIRFLAAQGLNAVVAPADLDAAIADQQVDVALRISPTFAEDWRQGRPALVEILSDSTRRAADIPVTRLRKALTGYSAEVGALRLLARGIDPRVAQPLSVADQDLASAEARRNVLLSALLPVLLIISSFVGGAYLILDATAGERERQSLEPLLTTPAPRAAIVNGKIAAACVVGLASLLLTLLAFKLGAALSSSEIGRQLDVGLLPILQMLLILLPMLFIGTALLTWLAASARSMKEAQSHLTWLTLLPMLPGYALVVYPLKAQSWQYLVPFLAQNQMLLQVTRHEPIAAAIWALYLGGGFALAALLWWAALRRYRQERLAISG